MKVTQGATVNIPANAPHQFRNTSGKTVHMLCMCTPAGQEEFFAQVGDRVASRTSPPPELQQGRAIRAREKGCRTGAEVQDGNALARPPRRLRVVAQATLSSTSKERDEAMNAGQARYHIQETGSGLHDGFPYFAHHDSISAMWAEEMAAALCGGPLPVRRWQSRRLRPDLREAGRNLSRRCIMVAQAGRLRSALPARSAGSGWARRTGACRWPN